MLTHVRQCTEAETYRLKNSDECKLSGGQYRVLKYRGTPSNYRVIKSFFASIATCFCFSYRLPLQRSFLIYSSIITN